MKSLIRKKIRILILLVLSVFMIADTVPALGVYMSGGCPYAQIVQAEGSGGQESRILSAKKKKKKKKNNSGSNNSDTGNSQNTNAGVSPDQKSDSASTEKEEELTVTEDGTYTSKEEVALYIHLYNHLPDNFITKSEAQDLGWNNREGNLDEVAPGKSIGGDRFGNYEGLLPEKNGRKYRECDIDFDGGFRGSKRIIYSSDGLIYYTEDHYKTFERLY